MKTLKSLFCAAVLFAMGGSVFANTVSNQNNTLERERDQLQQKQETMPSQDDLLRFQQIGNVEKPEWGLSDAELLKQPEKLEQLLTVYLAQAQHKQVAHLVNLYKKQHIYRDNSLIEWATAMLHSQTNLRRSIHEYRVLTGKFPDNLFIRYQLATLLFKNKEYEAAEGQFQKLRSLSSLTPEDVKLIDTYLNVIARQDKWNFGLGATLIQDKNLDNQAKVGTAWILPNGRPVTQDVPHESGTGFNFNVNTSKQWSLPKGQYVDVNGSLSMKYYWDNKGYNELGAYGGVSYGYADANMNVRVSPYISKQFKAGGKGASSKLSAYTNTYGAVLAADVWVSPKWKQSASYIFSRVNYADDAVDKRHGGKTHTSNFGATYYRTPRQYFGGGVNASRFDAGFETSSYKRYGGRLYWGQEWNKGFVTNASVNLYERKYKAPFFNVVRQKDKELETNISLWHKAIHYKGITPRLSWSYYKRKSNIDIFSYDKHMTFIELDKSF